LRRNVLLLGFLTVALLWPSCRRKTGEDAVLETIDHLVRLAEEKDLEGIMASLTADFADFEGRDKDGLRRLLASHFEGRTGIVAHKLGSRIVDFETDRALVEVEVALSSGGAEALRRLVRISPDIYRLRLDFLDVEGNWRIGYAEWSAVGLDGLLPGSLVELKKIFPMLWSEKK
jgi:hypothetical protein